MGVTESGCYSLPLKRVRPVVVRLLIRWNLLFVTMFFGAGVSESMAFCLPGVRRMLLLMAF